MERDNRYKATEDYMTLGEVADQLKRNIRRACWTLEVSIWSR